MKIKSLMSALVIAMSCGHATAGGIPVFDAASNALQTADNALQQASWMQQAKDMASQIMTLKNQYEQLKQQYQSMTGTRGMSGLLNNSTFQQARRMLPPDAQQILGLANGGSYGNLGGIIDNIKQDTSTLNTSNFTNPSGANQWNADLNRVATNKALSQQVYDDANQRLNNLEAMLEQISTTEDPKAIAELQARIQVEQGLVQNDQARINALQMLAAAEQQISQMKAREVSIKMGGANREIPTVDISPIFE
jgi:type IV secretion system protein VirB5